MPALFVIHMPDDTAFVRDHLLPPLPALGFDRLLSPGPDATTAAVADASRRCAAVLAVVPARVSIDPDERDLILAVRDAGSPVILVPRSLDIVPAGDIVPAPETAGESGVSVDAALASLPAVEGGSLNDAGVTDDRTLWRNLADLLPASTSRQELDGAGDGLLLAWNARAFSSLLADAVGRLDHHRSAALVAELTRHLSVGKPYPAESAQADLNVLRKKRQFTLMSEYATAALRAGTTDFNVRRQYAQALIELGEFDSARQVLEALITDAPATDKEASEARGLLGRLYKQLYVNAPDTPDSAANLQRALDQYGDVFQSDERHTWQGINTASLMARAGRAGVNSRSKDSPASLASRVLTTLDDRQKARAAEGKGIDVWDVATRVEACIAVGDIDAAERALDEYLAHPDLDAFEVSSTYRQFDEVLQLGRDPRTRPMLDRLWQAVQRHRTSGVSQDDNARKARDAGAARQQLLLGVSDPTWNRTDVPDLKIHARIGTVLSISGTERTVQALMKDPLVVSVEASRPAAPPDCVRSLPFINVTDAAGAFRSEERGDHALVAFIDDGIDVLHAAFLDAAGTSRIVGIWDQGAEGTPPPGFDFGTYYSAADIAAFVAKRDDPAATVPARLRNADGHGTHVASIAAGRRTAKFNGGVAPNARILVVISAGSDPTGYSSAHVAALAFIDQTARSLRLPVVINVSQGMNAGAHDGKSLVEVAFDEFSKGGRMPGRIVVKSAGNERNTKGHAEMQLQPEEAGEFAWTCREQFWQFDRLEFWWNSANQYNFRLRTPGGERSDWLSVEAPVVKGKLAGVKFRMEFVRHHVDNGDSRLILELGSGFSPIPAGDWVVEVVAVKVPEDDVVHGWIERRNGPRSEFVGTNANERMTLSIPGTAGSVITVAAIDAAKPIVVGDFSSYGPTRDGRRKPDVCAPGVKVIAARGGTLDDARPDTGTSMAAPHVAGAIALVLSKRQAAGQDVPSATQVGAVLRQNTLNPSGRWTPGQGYGVIDVAALLNAF